jgi:hypothetical protein
MISYSANYFLQATTLLPDVQIHFLVAHPVAEKIASAKTSVIIVFIRD